MQQVLRNSLLAAIAAMGMTATAGAPALRALPVNSDARVAANAATHHAANATKATSSVRILGDDYQPAFRAPASSTQADVLADENFSNLAEGTPDAPATIIEYGTGTLPVPEGLMNAEGWTSNSLYGAGGMGYLKCSNPQYAAVVCTPMGDWSGSITISFKVRPMQCTWGGGRARVQVIPFAYGSNFANTNIPDHFFEFLLLDKEGWAEVSMTYENYTADNEGYVMLGADSDVLIDDVKITSETDFLPNPVMLSLSDIKEDSFTINWMPVRKAREYYIHLFSLDGENEDGTPRLKREWPAEYTQDEIDMYKDWVEQGWLTPDYLAYEQAWMGTSYTFKGLNPEKEYYYCVQAHRVDKFSASDDYYHAMFVAAPQLLPASGVDHEAGKYTANWLPVAKADGYFVNNYGVHSVAEDTRDFVLLNEDFDNMPSEAEGINDMTTPIDGADNNAVLNQHTSASGWTCKYLGYAKGMAGVSTAFNGFISTPGLYLENDEVVRVKTGILAEHPGQDLIVTFAGVQYQLHLDDNADYCEVDFEMPVNNYVESPIHFYSSDGQSRFLIDYITVTQDVRAGSHVYVFQSQAEAGAGDASVDFEGLDFGAYDNYAYLVTAYYTFFDPVRELNESCTSRYAGRQLVDIEPVAVPQVGIDAVEGETAAEYFDLMGRRVANPKDGIFVKVQNGRASKVKL